MKRLSSTAVLVLAAFTVPLAVELRTVAGFFGVELSTGAVILFEVVLLAIIFGVYTVGQVYGEDPEESVESATE